MKTLKIISFCCLTLLAAGSAYAALMVPACLLVPPGTKLGDLPTLKPPINNELYTSLTDLIPPEYQNNLHDWEVSIVPNGANCLVTLIPLKKLPTITCTLANNQCKLTPLINN